MIYTGPRAKKEDCPPLNPKFCPRCGREAYFRYTSEEEARKQSPICWNESTCKLVMRHVNS